MTRQRRPTRRAALIGAALVFVVLVGAAPALGADSVYWGTTGSPPDPVRVGNLDGSGSAASLFSSESVPFGVAIDPAAGKIYWTDYASGAIRVANLDGTGSPASLFTGESNPAGVTIDPAAGKIYWVTDVASGAVRVANLDGSGSPTSLFTSENRPIGVAIDPSAGKIYWAANGSGAIRVGNLNGSGSPTSLFMGETNPQGVAIDPPAGKIYWASAAGAGAIRVGNLNGSGSPASLFTGENSPNGVAIDPAAGKIYWASYAGAIRVGNLDGSGSPASLFTGENSPDFPALLRSPAPAGAPQISGGSVAGSVLSCSQGSWAPDILESFLYRAPQIYRYTWIRNGAIISGAHSSTIDAGSGGTYICYATAINHAGSATQASPPHSVAGTLRVRITKKKINQKKHTARFRFKSTGATGFQCALIKVKKHGKKQKPHFKRCKSPKTYKHLKKGKYKFEVRAVSTAGPGTPATKTFKIR